MSGLLTREQFKKAVFQRDEYECLFCLNNAVDAHHIIDRKCWNDGGYYLDNGASVCTDCHLKCESGELSVEFIRETAEIYNIVLPEGWSPDLTYDKWGKIMNNHFKFPKTMHLPWSPGLSNDDRVIEDTKELFSGAIIMTEKMDGENTTMYRDHIHARSIDSKDHPSRTYVKGMWAQIRNDIPEGYRLCGENLFAKHSILYDSLPSYFMGISIFNEKNDCLSWQETREYFSLFGIPTVPEIAEIDVHYMDDFGAESNIRYIGERVLSPLSEGYVVRRMDQFNYSDYSKMVAKYVRKNHVQTDEHWLDKPVEKNGLKFW